MNEIMWTIIGTGAAVVGLIYTFLRNFKSDVSARLDGMTSRLDGMTSELKDIHLRLNDLDKRLYAVETVLHMKDCCVLKQDQNMKKAE